jgi:hypothetical protein
MKKLLLVALLFTAKTNAQKDTLVAKKIDSVVVVAKKPSIQVLTDKTVLHVESMLAVAGQNALELLKAAPNVVVDGNENITMSGKTGVTILIDGRNTNLSSGDLAQLLKSIEASNIKEIEIITNPSAKYDAAGNAGIINIKLKKSLTNGFNGNIAAGYSQSIHARGNINAAVNFRRNKWNLFSNAGFNKGFQNTIANNNRSTLVQNYLQQSIEGDDFMGNSIRAGADYSINKINTIGFLWMNNFRNTTMNNNSNTLLQKVNAADTNVSTKSFAPFNTNRNNINLNYKYSNTNEELNVDADYSRFKSTLNNTVTNELSNQFYIKFDNNASQNNAAVKITIGSFKVDYTKKINAHTTIDAGIKTVYTQTNNNLNVLHYSGNNWLQDTGKTNLFNYQENIYAVYTNYNKSINKVNIQLGLRAEQTRVKGSAINLKNEVANRPDTSYFNLFPTVFIQYKLAAKHALGFNYGKRIDRPSYQDQNPFIYVLDAFNSEVGNPYLQPQITNAVEVSYTYNYATSIKIKYAQTHNYIEQLTYQNGSNTIMIPQNAGKRDMINVSISSPIQVNAWWSAYISAEPYWQQYQTKLNSYGLNATTKQNSVGFNGYLGNWFSFKNNYKAEISGWFNYQNTTTIYKAEPIGSLNIGCSKNCFNNKLTFRFTINDVLNTQRWQQTVQTIQLNMLTYRKWESRNLSFSCTFRFGNNNIKAARDRKTGAETEMERIKSK